MPPSDTPTRPIDGPSPDSFLACLDCAKAKAKCEKKFPCARCVRRKIPCQMRLTQRGPGRGNGSTRKQSLKNTDQTKVMDTQPDKPADDQQLRFTRDRSNSSCFDLNSITHSHFDFFLSDDDQHNISNIGNLPYLNSDTDKTNPYLNSSLDSLMQQNYLELSDVDNFTVSTDIPRQADPIDITWSSQSQSSYGLSPELPDLQVDTQFSGVDENTHTIKSAIPIASADGTFLTLEAWPFFQCNPVVPSSSCPTTAKTHLQNLYAGFSHLMLPLGDSHLAKDFESMEIESVLPGTRDKLMAIMQSFSNKAQRIYGLTNQNYDGSLTEPIISCFLILPSQHVLESLLRACHGRYEPYYPFLSASLLKPNALLETGANAVVTGLQLLLLLTGGATAIDASGTYEIVHGLLEICRVALANLLEGDIKLATNIDVLHCALGYVILAAWSGDKWQMDAAIYMKAMFIQMLCQSSLFSQRDVPFPLLDFSSKLDHSWLKWIEQESIHRMAYSWVLLDQEMCLLLDIPSALSDVSAAVPSPDAAWHVKSAEQWAQQLVQSGTSGSSYQPSLNDYVRRFRETDDVNTLSDITPTTLRLLLCHIQGLVNQFRINISEISESNSFRAVRHTSMVLLSVHLDQAQDLLQKWYTLAKKFVAEQPSQTTHTAMILYHFIVLNTLVSFPHVERLARGEVPDQSFRWRRPHHFEDTQHIYFHCGQILRIIRFMPELERPSWWGGAVYRIALIAWANSMSSSDADSPRSDPVGETTPVVILDALQADHPLIETYLSKKKGTPGFSEPNGATVSLEVPGAIILHCARFLGPNPRMTFVRGIQQKLLSMARRWEEST
ncbi:hypothetical protein BP5796_01167 [Coleophoma crateriformis]|uniref:Zn(2)-C6 fungal-type domain-containing protein n=1 Tax=Coleophoma crateriformis TaxID=565419 RepID=A0A3D8SZL7_9HELO|nr:hypothetical protein BP5796_01167 [Coleophoma crateriformis]